MELRVIARIYNDFKEKFGIPRQSGITHSLISRIVFEGEYRNDESLRGICGFSHLWLLWQFSESVCEKFSPTVRPPRLGGNKRIGVFATRSPYRPNPIGLSSVRLLGTEKTKSEGTVLLVTGADIMSGTPIYDIKPYLSFTDSHPDARGGFSDGALSLSLSVSFPESLLSRFPESVREDLIRILENDPRPHYQSDPDREYVMAFSDKQIHFKVKDGVLTVIGVT